MYHNNYNINYYY